MLWTLHGANVSKENFFASFAANAIVVAFFIEAARRTGSANIILDIMSCITSIGLACVTIAALLNYGEFWALIGTFGAPEAILATFCAEAISCTCAVDALF
jgi:hypothetical protein